MKNYKYKLDETSKKYRCPSCNKSRFVRFINIETNEIADEHFGRCDRELSCGYFKYPNSSDASNSKVLVPQAIKEPSFIDYEIVSRSLKGYSSNPFIKFLLSSFDEKTVDWLIDRYKIGTSKQFDGSVVFWQIDNLGFVRTGKIMNYNSDTGRRSTGITWAHKKLGISDFELSQCLFGLHLISDSVKMVAIVESEKTAILLTIKRPDIIWLATGSLSNFSRKKLEPIKGIHIKAFPDKGCYDKWLKVAQDCNKEGFNIEVSKIMEEVVADKGADIADVIDTIRYSDDEKKYHKLTKSNPYIKVLVEKFDLHDKFGKKLRS